MRQRFLGLTWFLGLFISANLWSQSLYLKIEGENQIETSVIDSLDYKKQFQDYSSLNQEILEVKKQIEKLGYLESELKFIKRENDSTFSTLINLHEKYKSIYIYYNGVIDKKSLSAVTSKIADNYFEIPFENLEESLSFLNMQLVEKGLPFSTLIIEDIIRNEDLTLSGQLRLLNQQQRSIDTIIVKGYEKFPKSFIRYYLKLKPKQVLSLNTINERTLEIDNLRFANQIKEPELLFTKDSTSVYIYVEKTKSNSFDGFLGFGTNEQTNKIEFNGYLLLSLINNLNYGEAFRLYYKSDENDQRTFDLKMNLPYLFGSPLGTELNLNIFKRDSSFITASQYIKAFYQLNSKNVLALGVQAENSNNLLENGITSITDYRSLFYFVNYSYIKTQKFDLLFPANFLFDVTFGTGTRTLDQSKENQTRLNFETYKIFSFNDKTSIYSRLTGSILTSDTYLENELFRFGGINSIRGFEENSLLANLFTVLNTEYRYRLNNALYVHSILDAAYFENQNTSMKQKLFGFGFGFGLLTKAGLFKFNYSSGKIENQPFKLSDSKIQISLTSTF